MTSQLHMSDRALRNLSQCRDVCLFRCWKYGKKGQNSRSLIKHTYLLKKTCAWLMCTWGRKYEEKLEVNTGGGMERGRWSWTKWGWCCDRYREECAGSLSDSTTKSVWVLWLGLREWVLEVMTRCLFLVEEVTQNGRGIIISRWTKRCLWKPAKWTGKFWSVSQQWASIIVLF